MKDSSLHTVLRRRLTGVAAFGMVGIAVAGGAAPPVPVPAALPPDPSEPAVMRPMGNVSVNQYVGLMVTQDAVLIDHVIDMAAVPALETRAAIDVDGNGNLDPRERDRYAAKTCRAAAGRTRLTVMRRPARIAVGQHVLSVPAGDEQHVTLRLECSLRAPIVLSGQLELSYDHAMFADRLGWNEVTAVGDDKVIFVDSDVPSSTASARLTAYPADALMEPRDVRTANLVVRLRPTESATGRGIAGTEGGSETELDAKGAGSKRTRWGGPATWAATLSGRWTLSGLVLLCILAALSVAMVRRRRARDG